MCYCRISFLHVPLCLLSEEDSRRGEIKGFFSFYFSLFFFPLFSLLIFSFLEAASRGSMIIYVCQFVRPSVCLTLAHQRLQDYSLCRVFGGIKWPEMPVVYFWAADPKGTMSCGIQGKSVCTAVHPSVRPFVRPPLPASQPL